MQSDHKQYFVYLLPCIALAIFYIFRSYSFQIHDFANYYFGAKAILNNSFTPEIYSALHFNQLFAEAGVENLFINYYPNTPFISVSFIPLTFLEWEQSKLIHNIIGSALFIISIIRLSIYCKLPKWNLLFIPVLFLVAIKNNILFGQTYFFILFLITEGFLLYEKNKTSLASILWSLAILIKVIPIVILFWLCFKKDLTTIFKITLCCLLVSIITIPIVGFDSLKYYMTDAFPSSSAGLIYDGFTVRAKSAIMLFKIAFIHDALLNKSPIVDSNFLFMLSNILYKGFIFSAAASLTYHKSKDIFFSFSIWIVAGLLIGPTSSSYSKILLLLPIIYVLSRDKESMNKYSQYLILGITVLIINYPSNYLYNLPMPFNFIKLILLFIVFILLLRLISFEWSWLIMCSFLALFTIQTTTNPIPESDFRYLKLNHAPPTIMSKLKIKNGSVHYVYWGVNGEKEAETNIKISAYTKENIQLINNQLFYNDKQITDSKDRKLDPYLINQSTIIFLSDSGRAPGCYTIRKIEI